MGPHWDSVAEISWAPTRGGTSAEQLWRRNRPPTARSESPRVKATFQDNLESDGLAMSCRRVGRLRRCPALLYWSLQTIKVSHPGPPYLAPGRQIDAALVGSARNPASVETQQQAFSAVRRQSSGRQLRIREIDGAGLRVSLKKIILRNLVRGGEVCFSGNGVL